MKKIYWLLLFSISILTSCNKSKTDFFSNGKVRREYNLKNNKYDGIYRDYFVNGEKRSIHIYENGIKKDSSIYFQDDKIWRIDYYQNDTILSKNYNKNSKIKEIGKLYHGIKIGKWKYYRKNGTLEKIFEYINLDGKQYTNQGWFFDKDGDTIKDLGNYFSYRVVPNIVEKNKLIKIEFTYKPLLAINSNVIACMSSEINKDFSNVATVKLDTTYFENSHSGYQEFIFSKKGKKNIRGFIKEFYRLKSDSLNGEDRLMYFDIPINIK